MLLGTFLFSTLYVLMTCGVQDIHILVEEEYLSLSGYSTLIVIYLVHGHHGTYIVINTTFRVSNLQNIERI